MAKSRKTTAKEQDQMLETPAGAAVANEPPVRADWPESTETRELTVKLSDAERIQCGVDLVAQRNHTEALISEKKHAMKRHTIGIDKSKEVEAKISEGVQSGIARRNVTCRTLWQTNGFDAEGHPIYHSEMKTLVREDTGGVVEIKPITLEDRLFAPSSASIEELLATNQKAIMAANYTLEETPDDSTIDSPFVLIAPDGVETPIDADSFAEAAAKAVTMLPKSEPPTETEAEPPAEKDEQGDEE